MRSYSVLSRAALWAALVFVGVLLGRSQVFAQSGDPYQDGLSAIKQLRKVKVINSVNVAPLIDTILVDMLGTIYNASDLKKTLVRSATPAKMKAWQNAAYVPEGDVIALMSATREGIPNNFTDVRLRHAVSVGGNSVKRNVTRVWNSKNITTNELQSIEVYQPSVAANLVYIITDPWFVAGELPVGARGTTSASESYRNVVQNIRLAEFAKRSVVVKLLANMGEITISPTVDAQFIYSGWPDVVIDISFTLWSQDDVPELNRLLANPHYHDATQAELNALSVVEN